jgi:uncharacterized protein YjbI with pentapeptide repeats
VRTLARSRTLTVLRRLDGERKGSVVLFLQESTLLEKGVLIEEEQATADDGFIIDADLSEADLSEADLSGAISNGTDLRNANLSKAN